jgi:hypothetical protein
MEIPEDPNAPGSTNRRAFAQFFDQEGAAFSRLLISNLPRLEPTVDDLSLFYSIVRAYNIRDLTYPEDAYRAFAGIAAALTNRPFKRGFLWGLPIDLFAESLLWLNIEPVQRRLPSKSSGEVLPSWSWLGWRGSIYRKKTADEWKKVDAAKRPKGIESIQYSENVLGLCNWQYEDLLTLPGGKKAVAATVQPGAPGRFLYEKDVEYCEVTIVWWRELSAWTIPASEVTTSVHYRGMARGGVLYGGGEALHRGTRREEQVAECIVISRSGDGLWYHLLWIESEGDHVVRKGAGMVEKALWDSFPDRRRVDIKLG